MQIVRQDDDADGFVVEVQACLLGIIRAYHPAELFLVKTNSWFGGKWLGFSGKVEGAFGVWKNRLTVPPFVPHRILWERRYVAPNYEQAAIRKMVHVETPSQHGQKRYISDIAPNASFVWYSGASRSSKRASIMAYLFLEHSYWAWYTGWVFRNSWKVAETSGATIEEFENLRRSAGASSSECERV
jgi:hypothetical protein